MSLVAFHRLLITCGILFCLGYAGWEVRAFLAGGSLSALLLVGVFTVLAALLGAYLWQLDRFLGYGEDEGRR